MTTKCPSCSSLFDVVPALYGKHGRCSDCGEIFQLPQRKSTVEDVATVTEVKKGGIVLKDPKSPSILFGSLLFAGIIAGIWAILKYLPLGGKVAAEGETALQLPEWSPFLGALHPLLVHLPIGILLVVGVMEFFTTRKFRRRVAPATTGLLWFGTVGSVVAAVAGYLLAGEGPVTDAVRNHMILGFAVLVLSGAALVLKICFENSRTFFNRILYLAVLGLTIVGLCLAGHLGGSMTHGSSHLTEHMPEPMREGMDKGLAAVDSGLLKFGMPALLGTGGLAALQAADNKEQETDPDESEDPAPKEEPETVQTEDSSQMVAKGSTPSDTEAGAESSSEEPLPVTTIPEDPQIYADLVQPIFDAKCVQCHGEEKIQGKLRMDSLEHIMKGGSEGELVIPNDVEGSLLIYRAELPLDDDEHMPPEDEEQLTAEEIALFRAWIASGAKESGTASELSLSPEAIKAANSVRSGLIAAAETEMPSSETAEEVVEATTTPKAPEYTEEEVAAAMKSLTEEAGTSINFVSQQDQVYDFNALNGADRFGDEQLVHLAKLGAKVERANLARTKITDAGLEHVAQLTGLKTLHLENTAITDAGLAHLAGLQQLEYLNLYGTKVTDEGVRELAKLPALKKLYLWQTQVTPDAKVALQWINPALEVNMGSALVPKPPAEPKTKVPEPEKKPSPPAPKAEEKPKPKPKPKAKPEDKKPTAEPAKPETAKPAPAPSPAKADKGKAAKGPKGKAEPKPSPKESSKANPPAPKGKSKAKGKTSPKTPPAPKTPKRQILPPAEVIKPAAN